MANQSFSYVHPCNSSFPYSNKMLNKERNDSGLNSLNMDNGHSSRRQSSHHLFNESVNLFEYQPIVPKDSHILTTFTTTTTTADRYSPSKFVQASRSVPSSRRNSNEKDTNENPSLESLFNSKMQLGRGDQSMSSIPDSSVLFHKDGRFGKSTHRPSLVTSDSNQQLSSLSDMATTYAPTTVSESMLSSLAFDQNNSNANPIFQHSPHLSQNNAVYQHQPSSFVPPNDYTDLFTMQKTPTRNNKSLESLRSKSWTQYLDHPSTNGAYFYRAVNNDTTDTIESTFEDYPPPTSNRINYSAATSANGFYNPSAAPPPPPPPRRSSYGWQNSESNQYQGFSPDLTNIKTRLTTSQSHSDLRATNTIDGNQHVGTTTAASFGFYNGSSDMSGALDLSSSGLNTKDQQPPLCHQYLQYGYCTLGDQCHFAHPMLAPTNDVTVPTTTTASSSSPRLQQPSPTSNAALYSSYPVNALFNPSATMLNNPSMGPGAHTALPIFPVGASSSVYGRGGNGALPFQPSSPPQHHQHHMYKLQQHEQQQQQQQMRRPSTSDQDSNRFMNATLDDFKGHLYELAKDQNGCRFLQRKIEDTSQNNAQAILAIYEEIHGHFVELMTSKFFLFLFNGRMDRLAKWTFLTDFIYISYVDSFGNYLCQKLLERCDSQQRDKIVDIVAPDIVNISLNMHGTRAVQKLIEFLSTPDQIQKITSALNPSVVPLIKDLNGNHVIQKCLHRLSAEHRQFIYDAVSEKCVEVATHKHGCCVLQRCIDYASASQKAQLVQEITRHALPLVQDPYGNYVVQYVLELGNPQFSDGLIRRFIGHTCYLSAQKFSSNVIEKCIRVASPDTRRLLIAEFIDPPAMEKLLRDSFANYVIQTSLDYAEADQRAELVECIRPQLAAVRSTPYGKRIHGKIFRDQQRSTQHFPLQQHQMQQQQQQHQQHHQQQQQQQNRHLMNNASYPNMTT
ncbi:unnamed protein product [Absidia cylindrospora]